MKIICLTPTGDRAECLALSRIYFERARDYYFKYGHKLDVEWLVVDDGIKAFDPGGCTYLRRTPDGPNSLGRNLLHAFNNGALDCEYLFMWEDDDWYAQTRIYNQYKQLNRWQLHGYSQSIYYHLSKGGYHQHENFAHSSLFETAMNSEVARTFKSLVEVNINEPFLDLLLWKRVRGKLETHCGEAIGIKGAKGRGNLGNGDKLTYRTKLLEDFIGGDAKRYENQRKGHDVKGTTGVPQGRSIDVAAK